MRKFCPNCGSEISEKVKFCPDCGADINSFTIETSKNTFPQDKKSEKKNQDPNVKPKYSTKKYLFYAGILIVAILILVPLILQNPGISVLSSQARSNSDTGKSDLTTLQLIPTESQTDRNIRITNEIVSNYHKTHIYTLDDMYVCVDMASDVWDMLKAQGIDAKITIGNVKKDITDITDADHAWVLAEVAPNTFLALEATGGYSVQKTDNPRYYHGWSYDSPKELKEALDKLKHPCPDGYLLGSDEKCHQACGGNIYCTGNSVCMNGQCKGCDPGYIIGDDLKCHQPCGSSTTYCTGDSVCVNNQCKGCASGYILGTDLKCHQPCGSTSKYCSGDSVCINGQCAGCSPGYYLGTDMQCHMS